MIAPGAEQILDGEPVQLLVVAQHANHIPAQAIDVDPSACHPLLLRGLEEGGDDYLTKPFAVAELTARLRNLVRRSSATQVATRLRALDLELDLLKREATRGSRVLRLTAQEFSLLEFLCRHAGRVVR